MCGTSVINYTDGKYSGQCERLLQQQRQNQADATSQKDLSVLAGDCLALHFIDCCNTPEPHTTRNHVARLRTETSFFNLRVP